MSKPKQNKYEITITVDENDGDYVTEISELNEKQLDVIRPLIKAIKKKGIYRNYMVGECGDIPYEDQYPEFDLDVHEAFLDYCPSYEYGFHTIESIYIVPLPSGKIRLL